MNRAQMLKEAICYGLQRRKLNKAALIIDSMCFDMDPLRERCIAYIPPNQKATDDVVSYLREHIEVGLKETGFADQVWLDAPYRGQIPEGSELARTI